MKHAGVAAAAVLALLCAGYSPTLQSAPLPLPGPLASGPGSGVCPNSA